MYGNTIERITRSRRNDLAVVDTAKIGEPWQFTFAQLNDRANRLANWLVSEVNVGVGDTVGMVADNGVEYIDAFFACEKIGATLVSFNPAVPVESNLDLVRDASPKVLIFHGKYAEDVGALAGQEHAVEHLLHIDEDYVNNSYDYEGVLEDSPNSFPVNEAIEPDSIAATLFADRNRIHVTHQMVAWAQFYATPNSRRILLNAFPMYSANGLLNLTIPTIALGGTVILTKTFEPEIVLGQLQSFSVTAFPATPTMYSELHAAPNWDKVDLRSLQECICLGGAIPTSINESMHYEKSVYYRQIASVTPFGPGQFEIFAEAQLRLSNTLGVPLPYIDAAILNDDKKRLGSDELGQLALRGLGVTTSYFDGQSPGTWYETNLKAHRDENNNVFLHI